MTLRKQFKEGTLIEYKIFDDWRDECLNPEKYRVERGTVVSDTLMLNEIVVCNTKKNIYYTVPYEHILREVK